MFYLSNKILLFIRFYFIVGFLFRDMIYTDRKRRRTSSAAGGDGRCDKKPNQGEHPKRPTTRRHFFPFELFGKDKKNRFCDYHQQFRIRTMNSSMNQSVHCNKKGVEER